jgi:hypothetical protein
MLSSLAPSAFPKQVLHVVGKRKVQDGFKQVVNQVLSLIAESARSLFKEADDPLDFLLACHVFIFEPLRQ